ncbi:MAG: hypothetical protein ACPGZP_09745 [Panacagrimonas sp.]
MASTGNSQAGKRQRRQPWAGRQWLAVSFLISCLIVLMHDLIGGEPWTTFSSLIFGGMMSVVALGCLIAVPLLILSLLR